MSIPSYDLHCLFFLIQWVTGVLMWFLLKPQPFPVFIQLTTWGSVTQTPVSFSCYIQYLCIAFIWLSAAFHLNICRTYRMYSETITNNKTIDTRWIEYSFSASLMHVVIALQVGIHDLTTLSLIFVLIQLCMLFGWLLERDLDWFWFKCGAYVFLIVWFLILLAFFLLVSSETPPFVYAIVFSLLLLNSLFALVSIYLLLTHNRKHSEWMYTILSITAKQLLVWLTFWGANVERT